MTQERWKDIRSELDEAQEDIAAESDSEEWLEEDTDFILTTLYDGEPTQEELEEAYDFVDASIYDDSGVAREYGWEDEEEEEEEEEEAK